MKSEEIGRTIPARAARWGRGPERLPGGSVEVPGRSQVTRKLAACSVGLLLLVAFAAGCSGGSDTPFDPDAVHQVGWASRDQHAAAAKGSPGMASCSACHGADYAGGTSGQSCFTCHAWNAPHSKEGWEGGASRHQSTSQSNAAACAFCHRSQSGTPGCFNNTLCHG